MRRIFTILAALSVALSASAANDVIMKAVKSQKVYNGIGVGGPIKVFVEERTEGNIIIRATEKILAAIELKVEDGTLNITFPKGFDFKRTSNLVQAEVYVPNNGLLHEFTAAGCASIEVKPQIKTTEVDIECAAAAQMVFTEIVADKIDIEVVGAGSVKSNIECNKVDAEIAGASALTLSGKASSADFEVSGASSLKASELTATHLEAEISGASKGRMRAEQASVEVVGASNAEIECSTLLNASALGASTIGYSGDCQINISNNSGASTIKKR